MKANSCPLLYVLCAGLFHRSLAKVKYPTAKIFEMVDMSSFITCDSKWKRGDKEVETVFNVTADDAGAYHCEEDEVFVTVTDGPHIKTDPDLFSASDKVNVSCHMSFWFKDCKLRCTLTLMEGENALEKQNERAAKPAKKNFMEVSYGQAISNDSVGYHCVWRALIGERPNIYSVRLIAEKFGRAYVPVSSPMPNKLTVEVGQPVTCHAEGDPAPQFLWICDKYSDWSSEGNSLAFNATGNYTCVCAAWNSMRGPTAAGKWTGVLNVVPVTPNVTEQKALESLELAPTDKPVETTIIIKTAAALNLRCSVGLVFVSLFLVLWISGEFPAGRGLKSPSDVD